MDILEPLQLGEGWNEEGVHVELVLDHESVEAPESVLITREEHEQQRRHLGHALAVADLYMLENVIRSVEGKYKYHLSIVNAVRHQDIKELLLLDVISFPEHLVVSVGSVHVEINLPHLLTVRAAPLSETIVRKLQTLTRSIPYFFLLHLLVYS